jgi:membrane-associated phospholipid phosphatase
MRTAAQVVSVVLHPMTMSTFGLLCYYSFFPTVSQFNDKGLFLQIFLRVFVFTIMLPISSVLVMMRIGKVSSVFIEERKERSWPLLVVAAIYLATPVYILNSPRVPIFINLFILGAAGALIVALLINLKWKISLHMIGIGGLCGALMNLYFCLQEGNPLWLSLCFVLAGVLGTARLLLNAHNYLQILAGFALGFAAEFSLGYFAVH